MGLALQTESNWHSYYECDHPDHRRLKLFKLNKQALDFFINYAEQQDVANFNRCFPYLNEKIKSVVGNRAIGGAVILFDDQNLNESQRVSVSKVLAEAIGNILPEDTLTDGRKIDPKDHVEIGLKSVNQDVGRLLHFANPTLPWPLHTDRALKEDVGDWLMVAKVRENHASGGKIRLLHLDDFSDLARWSDDPLASEWLYWQPDALLAPPADQLRLILNPKSVQAPIFFRDSSGLCVRYTDFRFRRVRNNQQRVFIENFGKALEEQASKIQAFHMPVGAAYVVNNKFMLHGREGFVNEPGFNRLLLRFCGNLEGSK